ncbi:MAG: signal peptidase I [Candidatus Pacebacteria bacterium]|nr:signal peptidase I [Candidatus Paceibacterota bacterium]
MDEPKPHQPSFVDTNPSPSPATDPSTPELTPSSGFLGELFSFTWETLRVVLVSLVIILPVRYYVIQPFFVDGASMLPNFHTKEYILVDKWTYKLGFPERGDVIIFHPPNNPGDYYIKRILGLPGESILAGDNKVTVFNSTYPKGFTVAEKGYLPSSNPTFCSLSTNPLYCGTKVTLGEDEYFVMGDNREHSSDSRMFGPVKKSHFAGIAWLRLFPFDEISFIPRTEYPPVVE